MWRILLLSIAALLVATGAACTQSDPTNTPAPTTSPPPSLTRTPTATPPTVSPTPVITPTLEDTPTSVVPPTFTAVPPTPTLQSIGATVTVTLGPKACEVFPTPTPSPVPQGMPTPTPAPVLEIELRSVDAFDGGIKATFWFGPGGYGSVTLDGKLPDQENFDYATGPLGEFLFLSVAPGEHTMLAQGTPHRLEVKVVC